MSLKATFAEINHAILDLQASDYNTYDRPLKKLAQAVDAEPLREINERLKAGVDFDAFLESSNHGGSMVGSASLVWPTEREKELGLILILIERGAADPDWFMNFGHDWFYAGSKLIAGIRKLTGAVLAPFGRDYRAYVEANIGPQMKAQEGPADVRRVFIVHGHDEAAREMVARFISNVGLEPVILHEQANQGRTIPEKLIAYSNVGFAVVLLTPDDVGRSSKIQAEAGNQPRARQNVVLELGYFIGKLGRDRVCALKRGELEIPSDYMGVAYTEFDSAGAWKVELGKELQAAGYEIDWNRLMGGR